MKKSSIEKEEKEIISESIKQYLKVNQLFFSIIRDEVMSGDFKHKFKIEFIPFGQIEKLSTEKFGNLPEKMENIFQFEFKENEFNLTFEDL